MFIITNVNFVEYYSNNVPEDILLNYLLGSQCNYKGRLILTLNAFRELHQEGPFIIPPIRWLNSFEEFAEFKIICDVDEVKNG